MTLKYRRSLHRPLFTLVIAVAVLTAVGPVRADVTSLAGGAYGLTVDATVLGVAGSFGPDPSVTLPAAGGGPSTN